MLLLQPLGPSSGTWVIFTISSRSSRIFAAEKATFWDFGALAAGAVRCSGDGPAGSSGAVALSAASSLANARTTITIAAKLN